MALRHSHSSLDYLDKLVDECNITYYGSIGKKPIDADYSILTKEIETSHKAPKLKVGGRVRIAKYKNIFSKNYTENWSSKIFVIDYVMKTNPLYV